MPTCHASARPTRVLAVLPAPRFTGFAVLDGMGIASTGFASWNLRAARSDAERVLLLRKRLAAALSRFHPTVVVVGIRNWKSAAATEMQEAAEQIALRHGIRVNRKDSRALGTAFLSSVAASSTLGSFFWAGPAAVPRMLLPISWSVDSFPDWLRGRKARTPPDTGATHSRPWHFVCMSLRFAHRFQPLPFPTPRP